MKNLILIFVIFLNLSTFAQQDLLHKNGDIAFDSSFNCIYYANKDIAWFGSLKTFYYPGKIKAYEPKYKNIYYNDGNIAFNAITKNIYYDDGNEAFNGKSGNILDHNGAIIKNCSEITETSYTFTEKNIKITILKSSQINFELTLDDEDFTYITDLCTYVKILSKPDGKELRTVKIK